MGMIRKKWRAEKRRGGKDKKGMTRRRREQRSVKKKWREEKERDGKSLIKMTNRYIKNEK